MVDVEICVNGDTVENVRSAVTAAFIGGASRVELCSAMHVHGLTPPAALVAEARTAFCHRPGLMVMIRPREGNFVYTQQEIVEMQRQIYASAQAGADGVVIGVLEEDNTVARGQLKELAETGRTCGLQLTFHRAIDATPDPVESMEILVNAGVGRILTSGTPWGQNKGALDGREKIQQMIERARGRIEIIIGGGIDPGNVGEILTSMPLKTGLISVHAFSGAQENGVTTAKAVQRLVSAVHFSSSVIF
jgi:copper homeostasis protein